jgi:prevent-host-death family protein
MGSSTWKMQDAKARFSEVVRRARSDGPQHVTMHGREEAVVISAEEYRRMAGPPPEKRTGQELIDALRLLQGLDIERPKIYPPVRDTPDFNHPDFDK